MINNTKRNNKAMIFIDYEYCFYSYKNFYNFEPDPSKWLDILEEEYNIADVMVFGDFSKGKINGELSKIRRITNTIIETGNNFTHHKKDMTDFIMLDYIYQCADDRDDIDTYILFTGDSHFQSVIRYLTRKKKKTVVVCGIKDSFSNHLRNVASKVIELPVKNEVYSECFKMIISNMQYIKDKPTRIPTFENIVKNVAKRNNIPEKDIVMALKRMLSMGLLYKQSKKTKHSSLYLIIPDWDKIKKENLI